jgi:hypothetical protein
MSPRVFGHTSSLPRCRSLRPKGLERCSHFLTVSFVACCPSSFVVVEFGEELESGSDYRLPRSDIDGPGEHADRVGLVVAFAPVVEHFVGVGRLGSASVVNDVAPIRVCAAQGVSGDK